MSSSGYLFDTNIVIGLFANDSDILSFIKQATESRKNIYLSVMTECEIFSGLETDNDIHQFRYLNAQKYIPIDSEIARLAGELRREQKQKGRRLKAPDALIIATAKIHDLVLVSRDADMNFIQSEYNILLHKI
jgi:tRNA(fMet)-specific endonuclease VapC